MLNMKPNVTTNHIMVTIAPVHDHTRHQECEYTITNQMHVQFSILNCSVSVKGPSGSPGITLHFSACK